LLIVKVFIFHVFNYLQLLRIVKHIPSIDIEDDVLARFHTCAAEIGRQSDREVLR